MDNHVLLQDVSNPLSNPWYPRHVSDRVDVLIEEFNTSDCDQLYHHLKEKTTTDWFSWLEDNRNSINRYDALRSFERKRKLKGKQRNEALQLHHACIFLELWRVRLNRYYVSLPPNGLPIDSDELQRNLILEVLASYWTYDERDLWPFEYPEDINLKIPFPFKGESVRVIRTKTP